MKSKILIRLASLLLSILTFSTVITAGTLVLQDETIYLPALQWAPAAQHDGWFMHYENLNLLDVAEGSNGHFFLVGRHVTENYPGIITKIDPHGVPVWAKLHQLGPFGALHNVHTVANGDVIAMGTSPSYDGIPIVRHGSDGRIIWQQWINLANLSQATSDLTSDEGLILVASESYKSYIFRLNSSGQLQWQKMFGNTGNNVLNGVSQLDDDTFFAAGQTTGVGAGDWDGWVIKLNGSGDILWQKTFGTIEAENIAAIEATTDGGVIVTGSTNFQGQTRGWVMKLNGSGQVQWSRAFTRYDASSFGHVLATSDGGYILSGTSNVYTPPATDGWLVKVAGDGSLLWQRGIGSSQHEGAILEASVGGLIITSFWGLVVHLDHNGFAPDCPMIHNAVSVVSELPITISDYPDGPVTASLLTGGTWFHRDITLTTSLLCPQNGLHTSCADFQFENDR